MSDQNAPWEEQKFAGSSWVTNRDAQYAVGMHMSGPPDPGRPPGPGRRLIRKIRVWFWAVFFTLGAVSLALRPMSKHALSYAFAAICGVLALVFVRVAIKAPKG